MWCKMTDTKIFLTIYFKRWKMLVIWGKSFLCPWTRKWFFSHNEWNIGNVLVCAYFSSKLAHGAYCLCSIAQLFWFLGIVKIFSHVNAQNRALVTLTFTGALLATNRKRKEERTEEHIVHEDADIVAHRVILLSIDVLIAFANTTTNTLLVNSSRCILNWFICIIMVHNLS